MNAIATRRDEIYRDLAAEVVSDLQARAERVRVEIKRTSEGIVNIGQELLAARQALQQDGRFVAWLDLEFKMSRASAYRFINVAERFAGVSQIENIGPSVLYAIAAPSVSDQVVEATLDMSAAGEPVTTKTVEGLRAADDQIRNERVIWDHSAADVQTRAAQTRRASRPAPAVRPYVPPPPPPLQALDMSAVVEAKKLAPAIEATVRVQPGERFDRGRVCIVSIWREGETPAMHKTSVAELGHSMDILVWELIRGSEDQEEQVATGDQDE